MDQKTWGSKMDNKTPMQAVYKGSTSEWKIQIESKGMEKTFHAKGKKELG